RSNQFEPYMTLAIVYLRQKHIDKALEQTERALTLNPPEPARRALQAKRGQYLWQTGKPKEAAEACSAALAADPNYTEAHRMLGRIFIDLKDYEKAERSLTLYLTKGGKPDADVYRERGLARQQLGRSLEAVQDLTLGLAQKPDADLYTKRGLAYVFTEAWKLAESDFEKAVQLAPKESDGYIGRGL